MDDTVLKGLGPDKIKSYRTSLHPQTQRALRRRQSMQGAAARAYAAGQKELAQRIRAEVAAGEYRWIQPAPDAVAQHEQDEPVLGG